MTAPKRTPRLIQMRLLADSETCDASVFKRHLKGTGVEVDTTYAPKRVGPAVFVARGTATERVWRKLGWNVYGSRNPRLSSLKVTVFEELRFTDHDKVVELDDLWGTGAQAMLQAQGRQIQAQQEANREIQEVRQETAIRLLAADPQQWPPHIETF